MKRFFEPHSGTIYSLMRIVLAFLYLSYGLDKVFGLFGGNRPELLSLFGVAGLIETLCGLLLLLGLYTRPAAFIASGQMAAAYFISHIPRGPWPIANEGDLAAALSFAFLYFVARGPGLISLDHALGRDAEG